MAAMERTALTAMLLVGSLSFPGGGGRAAEGFFPPDGKQLFFQSEREPGNPFYQIYQLDLTTGETKRLSPGKGKTTCAFFQGHTGNGPFGSTHPDPRSEE